MYHALICRIQLAVGHAISVSIPYLTMQAKVPVYRILPFVDEVP